MRKIKIKKLGGPLYGQTKDGGLDDNQRIEKKEPSEINHVVKEVSRKKANVEVENNEIVFNPNTNTLQIVKGKTHEQGGVPADLQPGSFVFSDHLKLGGEGALIPGAKSGQTFAAALMKDVKPFNEAINNMVYSKDNDNYKQNAAELTISETIKKLKNLAMLQELQKGLKDGVPEFLQEDLPQAKNGGLIKMQKGGKPRKVDYDTFEKETTTGKYKVKKDDNQTAERSTFKTIRGQGSEIPFSKVQKNKSNYSTFYKQYGPDANEENWNEFFNSGKRLIGKDSIYYENTRKAELAPIKSKITPVGEKTIPKNTGTTPTFTQTGFQTQQQQEQQTDEQSKEVGYGYMDAISVLSPFAQRYNKQYPVLQQVNAPNIKFRPVDFEQERQRILGTSNTLGNFNNVYSPSASMASARNSMLLGEATEGVNQSFQKEFNTNELGYQEFDMKNAEMQNRATEVNANFLNSYNDKVVQTNTNFDAAMNMRDKEVLKNFYAAERQRVMKNLFNKTATDFNVDANYNIRKLNRPNATITRLTGEGGSSGEAGISFEQFKAKVKAKAPYLTDEELQKAYGDATMKGQLKQNSPNQSSGDFERLQQMMQ